MVIPASFRRRLGFKVGDTLIAEVAGEELRIRSRSSAVADAQKLMRELIPEDISLVDELIADRRAEAARE